MQEPCGVILLGDSKRHQGMEMSDVGRVKNNLESFLMRVDTWPQQQEVLEDVWVPLRANALY